MLKKIAFIGSVGSGKTTIIESLSNITPLRTDVESSRDIGKELTTVGIDYGQISLGKEMTLGLYGVPGQRKFSLIWDFVKEGLWAIVILIKNNDQESIDELKYLINYFNINERIPSVIGITHTDIISNQDTLTKIKQLLTELNINIPIFSVDARESSSAMLILETIIAIDENINE